MASRVPRFILVGSDGEEYEISPDTQPVVGASPVIALQKGSTGLDAPDFDVQTEEYPALDGSFIRAARASGREIFLPLQFWATDRPALRASIRGFTNSMNPKNGTVRIKTAEDASYGVREDERYIDCWYASGLEGDEGTGNGNEWATRGLILRATNPFFQNSNTYTSMFTTSSNLVEFFRNDVFLGSAPFEGFQISDFGTATTTITVDNIGELPAFPIWDFEGPLSGPFQLTLQGAPDRILEISDDFVLATGETGTINTDPRDLEVTSAIGSLGYSGLVMPPDLWALKKGTNTITIDNGTAEVPEQTIVTYRPQYMGM